MTEKLQQAAKYYLNYAGPMKISTNEIIQQEFNLLDRYPRDFKGGYFLIIECMEECNHPDKDLFDDYAQANIFGGWYYDSQTSEEREDAKDREDYTYYMIVTLAINPTQRFIPFENKMEWKAQTN